MGDRKLQSLCFKLSGFCLKSGEQRRSWPSWKFSVSITQPWSLSLSVCLPGITKLLQNIYVHLHFHQSSTSLPTLVIVYCFYFGHAGGMLLYHCIWLVCVYVCGVCMCVCLFLFVVLGIEPTALQILSRCSTAELHPQVFRYGFNFIFLVTSDIGHFSLSWLVTYMFSLENYPSKSFVHV